MRGRALLTRLRMPALFSIVVPTLGREAHLLPFLEALERQSLPRERFEIIVVFDGAAPAAGLEASLARLGARVLRLESKSGPPVARNLGAAAATGEYLVSTDDDVVPEPDWLARAAAHVATDPAVDVIEGLTRKPGGRAVRVMADEDRQYILCNLFVRRLLFERVGGFHEGYFDAKSGVFFREDADLGWSLERAGARTLRALDVVVVHPVENTGYLAPLQWTRRYVMDGLLAARFPREFRERIEVHRLGPLRVRRPIVRASCLYVGALAAAAAAAQLGYGAWASGLALFALACFIPVWAKWRFDPLRLPVFLLVPFGLVWALVQGRRRARRLRAAPVSEVT